jgi:DNA-binding NarL/FixJ family response regulator
METLSPRRARTTQGPWQTLLVVAASAARRAWLGDLARKNPVRAAITVVTSSGFSLGRARQLVDGDMVVADLDSPALAASMLQFVTQLAPGIGAVTLIDDPDARWVQAALKTGVSAIISREPGAEELRLSLAAADAGLILLHPTSARGLMSTQLPISDLAGDPEPLTAREREVLRLMGNGLANKEIAARLAISEHTAKFHISSILGKLSVATRTEAVSLGIRRGLIPI